MILVVDIGNTNIKYGVFENDELIYNFKQRTFNNDTSDEIGLFICEVFKNYGLLIEAVTGVIVSSVVPQIMFSFIHAIKKYLHKEPIIVGKNLNYDFSYISNQDIYSAADRLVGCYWANEKYENSAKIIIDFGTATTFDVIDDSGKYLGGAILPGLRILSEALTENTAQLPRVELQYPDSLSGVDLVIQIQAGIIYGYIGAVKNIIKELIEQVLNNDNNVKIIATGGFVSLIDRDKCIFDIVDKTLILDGLYNLYKAHKKNLCE